jgi:UDP-N-acetylmuramoyl-tripeptide--D-alanyl-D-alanine ligase
VLTLAIVIEALTNTQLPEDNPAASRFISEATIDSRAAIHNAMFVALPGERVDGHNYISDAFDNGATLALAQREIDASFHTIDLRDNPEAISHQELVETPLCLLVDDSLHALQTIARYWRRTLGLRVIGITGSVGKTTTKELITHILNPHFKTLKNPGNYNNEIGLPLTLLSLDESHQRAVLEMGFYVPGEIAFLCDLAAPDIGVITNIGMVHAERAGSQETIAVGKSELIQALPPSPRGTAILNYDDLLVRDMANLTNAEVIFYGLDPEADLWADQIDSRGLEGIRFRLNYRDDSLLLPRVPLIGHHSVHTALRAAAVGLAEGLTLNQVGNALSRQGYNQLRLVAIHLENGATILDDTYNASPASTQAALNLLKEVEVTAPQGRKIAVLGDMLELGPYEKPGHEMIGYRAAEVCDELIAVGERSKMIAFAASQAGLSSETISWFENSTQAADHLESRLRDGDIVLVKGSRGLNLDKIISTLEKTT